MVGTYLGIDYFRRIFFHYLTVLYRCFHKLGAYHDPVVGYGIVEGQYVHRRYLSLVADTHPRQSRFGKITLFGSFDVGLPFTGYLQMKRLVDAHALQTVHELLRIILVVLVDEVGDAHIGRNFQNTCHIYLSITSPVPVVVSHLAAVHIHNTVARVYLGIRGYLAIFQCHHNGGCLEGGARFQHIADGITVHFVVIAVSGFHHVDNGLYFSGSHFHQYGYPDIGIDFLQLVYQGFFADVLHAYVEGGYDVTTVYRGKVYDIQVFIHHLLTVGNTVPSFQQGVEGQFNAVTGSHGCIGIETAQGLGCQRTERLFTLVVYLFVEPASVFVHLEYG